MAKRRVERGPGRDDELVAVGAAPPTPAAGSVADHVLGLQREYGNAAVTTMVQRKGGKSRAASTDNPGYKKAKDAGKGKKAPPEANFLPEFDPTIKGSVGELRTSAGSMIGSSDPERVRKAIHWFEQAFLRDKGSNAARMDALTIGRAYEKLGDGVRGAWWKKVSSGAIDPYAEDMSGKGF